MRDEEYWDALDQMPSRLDVLFAEQTSWTGPAPGSQAAADDQLWPGAPPTDVVRNSILSGAEHARLLVRLLTANPAWPATVTYSVLRGVLVGACQALWIAACPDSALRRARALAVTHEDYRLRRAHHAGQTLSRDPDRAAHAAEWVSRWDSRIAALGTVTAPLPKVDRIRITDMVEWVGSALYEDGSDARSTLLATWQICSGYAHALPWSNFLLPGARPLDPDATGPTPFAVDLDLEYAVGEALMCMQILLCAHWHASTWTGRRDPTPRGSVVP